MKQKELERIILRIKSMLQTIYEGLVVLRGNYFGGESIRNTEMDVKVGKLGNRKAAGKHEVTGKLVEGV